MGCRAPGSARDSPRPRPREELEFSPDGRRLAASSFDSTLIWSVDNGKIAGSARNLDGVGNHIQFSPDGNLIASGFEDPGTVGLWDVADGRPLEDLSTGEYGVYDVAFTPDGTLIAAGDNATFFDTEQRTRRGKRLRDGGDAWVFSAIAVSPDGQTLAAIANEIGVASGALGFWNIETRTPLGKLITGDRDAITLAFSPDGRTVATGHDDGMLRLWDADRRTLVHEFRAHPATSLLGCCAEASTVSFSRDGWVLASGGRNGLRLWDKARVAPLGHPIRGDVVAFGPPGLLVSATDAGTLLWDSVLLSRDLDEWKARLCARASRNLTEAEWRRFLPDEPYRKTCS